jgi:hypothetical protein
MKNKLYFISQNHFLKWLFGIFSLAILFFAFVPKTYASYNLWSTTYSYPATANLPLVNQDAIATSTIYNASQPWTFSIGVSIIQHKGVLYSAWAQDADNTVENGPLEFVRGATSTDGGITWSNPFTIAPQSSGANGTMNHSHGAFLSYGGTLYYFASSYLGTSTATERFPGLKTELFTLNESTWQWVSQGFVANNLYPMETPKLMANGNWIMGGLTSTSSSTIAMSNGNNFNSWQTVNIPTPSFTYPAYNETSTLIQGNTILAIIRPPSGESYAYVSTSTDYGVTWSKATVSNYILTNAKPVSGTLSTGQDYIIDDTDSGRSDLVIGLKNSSDQTFKRVLKIVPGTPPNPRFNGATHQAGWAYPSAWEYNNHLYVAYYQSKEDELLTIIPLSALATSSASSQDPVAWWKLNESSGQTAADTSSASNTATLSNMTDANHVAGQNGNSLSFNGTNQFATANEYVTDNVTPLSVSVWANFSSLGGSDHVVVSHYDYQNTKSGWTLYTQTIASNKITVKLSPNGGSGSSYTANYTVPALNTWTHYAFTYDGSQLKFYINGSVVSPSATTGTLPSSIFNDINTQVVIGASGNSVTNTSYISGKIDDVRIYDRVLSASEVTSIYNYATSTVTTQTPSSVATSSMVGNGNITSVGESSPTVRGFVYGTTAAYGATTTENGSFSTGAFTASITGLMCNTLYHINAYAINDAGTSYGSDVVATIPVCMPTVTTSAATGVSTSTATFIGAITATGGADATNHGFAYGTVSDLSSVIATTSLGAQAGTTTFNQSLTGLAPNTTYYFRAYAVNSAGTSTGSIVSTNTSDITPPIVSMTLPASGSTVAGSAIHLSAISTDDVGVVGVQFMLDGITNIGSLIISTSSPQTYSTIWNSTGITSYSSHTLYAVAHDAAGNYATSTVSINVDNVNPTLVSAVYNSDTQITVTLSKLASSTTITKSNDGGFIVMKAGGGTVYAVSSIIPGSGDSIVLTTASMASAGATGVVVTYSHSGNGTIADALGNVVATNGTGITIPPWNTVNPTITNITSTVSNGAYKQGASIDIDLIFSKTIDSASGLTANFNSGGSCSTGAISDSMTASCTYTVGGSDNANPLNVASVTGLAASTDGNAMTNFTPALNLSANKTIVVDTTAPSVSITSPSNGVTVGGSSVALAASNSDTGSGITSVQFMLDGITNIGSSGSVDPYSIAWDSTSASNADHTLYAVAHDAAGNYATSSINITTDNTIHTYSISGNVSGLTGTVVLRNNSNDNLTITSDGSFTFDTSIANGNTYAVIVITNPSGQTCSVSSGSGTVSGDVTDISVICTTDSVTPTPTPTPTPAPTVTPTVSFSSSGGSVSASTLATLLAPGPATTAYLNSLNNQVPRCPTGFTCTPKPITNSQSAFTGNLQFGMTSSNVKQLQIFLNTHGFIVATSGPGSIGDETDRFGSATRDALIRFQKHYHIIPSVGYFGPVTRNAVNAMMK